MKKIIGTFAFFLTVFSSQSWAIELCQGQWVDMICNVENHPQLEQICIKQKSRFRADVMKINGASTNFFEATIEYVNLDPILSISSNGDIIDLRQELYTESNIDFELNHCVGQLDYYLGE